MEKKMAHDGWLMHEGCPPTLVCQPVIEAGPERQTEGAYYGDKRRDSRRDGQRRRRFA